MGPAASLTSPKVQAAPPGKNSSLHPGGASLREVLQHSWSVGLNTPAGGWPKAASGISKLLVAARRGLGRELAWNGPQHVKWCSIERTDSSVLPPSR